MTELAAIRQSLAMAWNMGFKYIQLELDSKVVLTNHNASYSTNMMPLICDCRSHLDQDWEMRAKHIYREANECADTLAKRRTHQRNLLFVYSNYPSFVNLYYVRDLAGLGVTRLCAQGSNVGDV